MPAGVRRVVAVHLYPTICAPTGAPLWTTCRPRRRVPFAVLWEPSAMRGASGVLRALLCFMLLWL